MKKIRVAGPPGTGKTQVGRVIAQVLGWNFVDTDEKIVHLEGKSILELFNTEGEASAPLV